ncbi:EI24 domain-containing protein [Paraburkholderia hayleyella]|uniref:EI24 domain-containing protein n=1 Tax=Paraburkholderia hayleyella TaxID=2152889 RepID=UPI0012911247|nr:EI24 domain-containing protein [Paraburkholderia hayleyella]
MNDLLRSFGRALLAVFHPRMLWLTFLPFVVAAILWGGVFWLSWQRLAGAVRFWLDGGALTGNLYGLLDWFGFASLHSVIAPFLVMILAIPLIVLTVLLLIATLSMPGVVRYLAVRRFAGLEMRHGGTWYGGLAHALWTTLVCAVLLAITLPLWLVPPFFAVIPPLLWGWLTYRVMTYDALALHASQEERRALVRRYRWPLLLIGIVSGLLGTLPSLLWVSSIWLIALFPFITVAMMWVYALILVFSALWFGDYCLSALARMRAEAGQEPQFRRLPERHF